MKRRDLFLSTLALALSPVGAMAKEIRNGNDVQPLSWDAFMAQMEQLATARQRNSCSLEDVEAQGIALLQRLNIDSPEYARAVADSYESGNRFWMWQRMAKQQQLNGGILTVERNQLVPMHDHPGAVGMLRILSGEVVAWQFDRIGDISPTGTAELRLVAKRSLQRGDIAVLSPQRGNIHALQALSEECSMLDFFIPPYNRQQRTWYQPMDKAWHEMQTLSCTAIAEEKFYTASPA